MKRLFTLLVLLALSAPVAAHHTKEHVLQPPIPVVPTATSPSTETDYRLWYALGPFFLLAAIGFARWGLKHRAARRPRKD